MTTVPNFQASAIGLQCTELAEILGIVDDR